MQELSFDKKRFVENVTFLATQKGINNANVEREIGVSAGYFSRFKNKESNTPPNIDTLRKLSRFFQVPIDVIYGAQIINLSSKEEELLKLFTKMLIETRSDFIVWKIDAPQTIKEYVPVFGAPEETSLLGPYIHYDFDESTEIFITQVVYNDDKDRIEKDYEMYSITNHFGIQREPICSTRRMSSQLAIMLRMIYNEAMASKCLIQLDEESKQILDAIDEIGKANVKIKGNIPPRPKVIYDPDEIPF